MVREEAGSRTWPRVLLSCLRIFSPSLPVAARCVDAQSTLPRLVREGSPSPPLLMGKKSMAMLAD